MSMFPRLSIVLLQPKASVGYVCARAVAFLAVVAVVLSLGAVRATADSCTNVQYRVGYSAPLPDCRAYEQVSPDGSQPYVALGVTSGAQAAVAGGAIGWETYYPLAGSSDSGLFFLSTRSATGWSTAGMIPPQTSKAADVLECNPAVSYSPDLSHAVLTDGVDLTAFGNSGHCDSDDPQLVAGEPQDVANLFAFSTANRSSYQLIDVTPAGVVPANATYQGASSDFSHILFDEAAPLTPNAPSGDNLYEWANGVVALVTVLPDGIPVQGSLVDPQSKNGGAPSEASFTHGISSDGSRVLFTADGNLYERENPMAAPSPVSGGACTTPADACTVQVDASQGSGPGGGGTFAWASGDGSQVFFTDAASAGLTPDTVAGSGTNLYRYDLTTGKLSDLTASGDARVQGVSGLGLDGAYVYFVADGALAAGATPGQPNLYVAHGGPPKFIATLQPGAISLGSGDVSDWTVSGLTSRTSPNGQLIAFNSVNSLTGDNNLDAATGTPDDEIYLYDSVSGELRCVSCNPSGAPPTGAASIHGPTHQSLSVLSTGYLERTVLDDGRVFFNSLSALLPSASDGQSNVYEFEPVDVGSCTQPSGCLSLISTGTSGAGSFFYDASASGDDVFIVTDQDLLGDGADGTPTIYDARVNGGFPVPASSQAACGSADGCRGASAPVTPPLSAGSVTFVGPGDRGTRAGPANRLRLDRSKIDGQALVLTVTVTVRGRVAVAGAEIRGATRLFARAGTYRIRVGLTGKARRTLKRKDQLRLTVRLSYRPSVGTPSLARVALTVRSLSVASHHAKRPRLASHAEGESR